MIGEGCDYTIGCGMRFYWTEANSHEDAQEKTIWPEGHDEYSSLEGEMALSEILIIPADKVFSVDVQTVKSKVEQIRNIEADTAKENKERSELQRLQAKYNT